jgi:alkanesulfonate monooxygenase SsuD/methylene tetrahydromethanopterin reductase-like flavin-dependent oxidoreductase (luciferase family)
MTGRPEWGLVTGPDGETYGVHSLSGGESLKNPHFDRADKYFERSMK